MHMMCMRQELLDHYLSVPISPVVADPASQFPRVLLTGWLPREGSGFLRLPLSHKAPGGKGAAGCGQLQGLWRPQNITNELLRIEPEKVRGTAECEEFMQSLPGSGSVPLLRTRVDDTNRKYERLVQLLNLAQEKCVAGGQRGGGGGAWSRAGTPHS